MTFEINDNSILTISPQEKGTDKKETISVTNDKDRLTKDENERMIADAESFADSDKILIEMIDAKLP